MRLYRISKSKFAGDLSGEGARKAGGRWNLKGTAVIYTADSTALATLEALVHSSLSLVPRNRSITVFEIPDNINIEDLDLSGLPQNWRSYPPPIKLAQMGSDWINKNLSLVLCVPSVIIPKSEGWNYLLNPYHSDFSKVQILKVSPFEFDTRLYNR